MNIEETMINENSTSYDSSDMHSLLLRLLEDENFTYDVVFFPHLSYLPVKVATWYGDKGGGLKYVGRAPIEPSSHILWLELMKKPAVVDIGRYRMSIATPDEIGSALSPVESMLLQSGEGFLPDWAVCQVLFQAIFLAGGRVNSASTLYTDLYLWLKQPRNREAKIRVHAGKKNERRRTKADAIVELTESLAVVTAPNSKAWTEAKSVSSIRPVPDSNRERLIKRLKGIMHRHNPKVADTWVADIAEKSKKELLTIKSKKEEKDENA